MYGLVTKLLVSRQLKFEKGKILVLGEPVCMLPLVYVRTTTKLAMMHHENNKADKSLEEMYFESWTAGYEITKKMTEVYKLKIFDERYRIAMDIIALFGFGDYHTKEFKGGEFAFFRVDGNPFALKFYPSKKKIDFFLAGANAGGGTIVHEVLINCVELECAAINGSYCKFINCNNEIFEKYKKKGQTYDMDWDYIIKKEIEYIKNDKKYGNNIKIPKELLK